MQPTVRRPVVALVAVLLLGMMTSPGCSSKPAQEDTAEVTPDPAVRPAPAPTPPPASDPPAAGAAAPTSTSTPATPAAEPKP